MKIKLFITDIDGVWTDGSMYYGTGSLEMKRFHTGDSAGVLFCRLNDIEVAIMTGEDTPIVTDRAGKLKIDQVYMGVKNKLAKALEVCSERGISLEEIAYIGDDLNDIPLLEKAGLSITVPDAPDYVKKHADYVCKTRGGDGAFREAVEYLLKKENLLEQTIQKYLDRLT